VLRRTASLALVAAGLITLASCSSGQPTTPSAKASTTAAPPPSATSAGGASPGVGASTLSARFRLLTEVFATPLPADPVKARIVEGFRESQILWDESTEQLYIVPSSSEYIRGQALVHLRIAVTAGAKDGVALAGTDRLFDTNVTNVTSKSATLTSCDDGRQTNLEDLASQAKIPNNPTPPLVYFLIWRMVPVGGHWAITSFTVVSSPDPRVTSCLA
jgi:hypothetical protein